MGSMMILNNLKAEAIKNNIPIVKDETLEKILETITKNNVKNILEIGSAIGYSAICFALLDKNIKIYTIEKDEDRYLKAKQNINNFNLTNQILIVNKDAKEHLEDVEFVSEFQNFLNAKEFDMIFIDAAKGQYLNFLENGIKYIKKKGTIVADNVLFKGYVLGEYTDKKYRTIVNNLRKFIEKLTNEANFETEIFEIDDGLLISKKL